MRVGLLVLSMVAAGCGPSSISAPLPLEGMCITDISAEDTIMTGYQVIACGSAGSEVVKVFSGDGTCPKPGHTLFIDEASGPISKVWFICLREL